MNVSTKRAPLQSRPAAQAITSAFREWWRARTQAVPRQLRLVETLALGPKRSVAIVEFEGQRFLAGMGADGVSSLLQITGRQHEATVSYSQEAA